MKDILKQHLATLQKFRDRFKPKNPKTIDNLSKARFGLGGKLEPEAKDPEGMPHPEDPTRIKSTSSRPGKQLVWKYRKDIADLHDSSAKSGLQNAIKNYPEHVDLLNALHAVVMKDPDRHMVGDIRNIGTGEISHDMRARHLANAFWGKPGYSIMPGNHGLTITAERHPKGRSFEEHSWFFDGKKLKFLGSKPISKTSEVGSNVSILKKSNELSNKSVLHEENRPKNRALDTSDSLRKSGGGSGVGKSGLELDHGVYNEDGYNSSSGSSSGDSAPIKADRKGKVLVSKLDRSGSAGLFGFLKKALVNHTITPEEMSLHHGHSLDPTNKHVYKGSSTAGTTFFHHIFSSADNRGNKYTTHVLSRSANPRDVSGHIGAAEVVDADALSPGGHSPVQVVGVNVKHVGQGHGELLYRAMLAHHGHLLSDFQLSPGADKLWREKLSNTPGVFFKAGDKPHQAHEVWIANHDQFNDSKRNNFLHKSSGVLTERLAKMKWLHGYRKKDNKKPEIKTDAQQASTQEVAAQPAPAKAKPAPAKVKKEPPTLDYSKINAKQPNPESADAGEYWKEPSVKHSDIVKQNQLKNKMLERHSKNPETELVQGKNKTIWVKNKEKMNKSSELRERIAKLKTKYEHGKAMMSYQDKAQALHAKYNSLSKTAAPVTTGQMPIADQMQNTAEPMLKDNQSADQMQNTAEPMLKDNQPHAAGSPADSAHDVAEGVSTLKAELQQQQTSQKRSDLLKHLKTLKESGMLRSKENAKVGID